MTMNERITILRAARLNLLQLHKLLIDFERNNFEMEFGAQSSGRFLQLLLSDERFEWLRVYSKLIVQIDENLELDDGITDEKIDNFLNEIKKIIYLEEAEEKFKTNYQNALQQDVEILGKHMDFKEFLSNI